MLTIHEITFTSTFPFKKIVDYLSNFGAPFRLCPAFLLIHSHPLKKSQILDIQVFNKTFSAKYEAMESGFKISCSSFVFEIQVSKNESVTIRFSLHKPWYMKKKTFLNTVQNGFQMQQETLENDLTILTKYHSSPLEIAMTGTSGLIGKSLCSLLLLANHRISPLVRIKPNTNEIFWDPDHKILDSSLLAKKKILIHLASENIDGIWTQRKKKKIITSRIEATTFLAQKLKEQKWDLFLCASAVGIYASNRELGDETSPLGNDFLADTCKKWEQAAHLFEAKRTVCLRFGIVLSKTKGALKKMLLPFRFHFGFKIESSNYLSWITIDDAIYGILQTMMDRNIETSVNITAKNPVTLSDFFDTLAKSLQKPLLFSIPLKWITKNEKSFLLFKSHRLCSKYPLKGAYSDLEKALRHLL